jgi:hypothetical protein
MGNPTACKFHGIVKLSKSAILELRRQRCIRVLDNKLQQSSLFVTRGG